MPWISQLVELSCWRPRFHPRAVSVGFVLGKVALA